MPPKNKSRKVIKAKDVARNFAIYINPLRSEAEEAVLPYLEKWQAEDGAKVQQHMIAALYLYIREHYNPGLAGPDQVFTTHDRLVRQAQIIGDMILEQIEPMFQERVIAYGYEEHSMMVYEDESNPQDISALQKLLASDSQTVETLRGSDDDW